MFQQGLHNVAQQLGIVFTTRAITRNPHEIDNQNLGQILWRSPFYCEYDTKRLAADYAFDSHHNWCCFSQIVVLLSKFIHSSAFFSAWVSSVNTVEVVTVT